MTRQEFLPRVFSEYDVSEEGVVTRLHQRTGRPSQYGNVVNPYLNSSGYLHVSLSICGFKKNIAVHRMVAHKYLGSSNLTVNHIDGDKLNNRPTNLEYVSGVDNTRAHFALNDLPGNAVVPSSIAKQMRLEYSRGMNITQIARAFNVEYMRAWYAVKKRILY